MYYGEKYALDKKCKIIIYGAATTGAIIYHNLTKSGFHVMAFIDKRADEIESYYDLPVWDMNQAEAYFKKDNTVITIIGIKNVFEHEKIAKKLWEIGCKRLIFRPYKEVDGNGEIQDTVLNETYDRILSGECPEESYAIEGFERPLLIDNAVLEEANDYIIANIPIYYVFTDNYSNKEIIWGDIPCVGLVPHIGLFKLFLGQDNEDYKEYIKFCQEAALRSGGIVISKAWENSVYSNRLDVFNHMQYAWEHDRDFFVRNAVEADYNQKGYFNIKSGKHRVVYLLVKGSRYIPLKLKREDYDRWNDKKQALRLQKLLIDMNIDSLPLVLGNPFFYNYPCSASVFYEKVLLELVSFIYKEQYYKEKNFDFNNKKILLYNTPLALYANIFKMLGFGVHVFEKDVDRRRLNHAVSAENYDSIDRETIIKNQYFLALIQDETEFEEMSIEIKYRCYISGSKKGRLLAGGLVDESFMYACMKTKI